MLTIQASEKLGREGMVEWNRIFRLFLFSGILGQARKVHLKFRNEIPENVLSIRSSPGISRIFGRMESAQCLERHFHQNADRLQLLSLGRPNLIGKQSVIFRLYPITESETIQALNNFAEQSAVCSELIYFNATLLF